MRFVLLHALPLMVVCSRARPRSTLQASTESDCLSRDASAVIANHSGYSATSPSLLRNQYIAMYTNRYMKTDKVRDYQWFTPLFCKKAVFWLDVTDVMHARQVERPCVRVTCQWSGDVEAEALADCGDASPILNNWSSYASGDKGSRGLRILPTYDPITREQMFSRTNKKNCLKQMDGRGFYDFCGALSADFMDVINEFKVLQVPLSNVWARLCCGGLYSNKKALSWVQPFYNTFPRPDETYPSLENCKKTAVKEKENCLERIGLARRRGVDWYSESKKQKNNTDGGLYLKDCDNYFDRWNLLEYKGTQSQCEKAIKARLSEMETECSQYAEYCNTALGCTDQALLPDPRGPMHRRLSAC